MVQARIRLLRLNPHHPGADAFSAPLEILTEEEIKRVEDFLLDLLHHGTEETRLVVLDILHWSEGKLALRPRMQEAAQALIPTQDTCDLLPESFLLYKIAQRYDETAPCRNRFRPASVRRKAVRPAFSSAI